MNSNTVFLYPGQGSQHVGMGLDLYETFPEARELFNQADRLLGFSLSRLCFEGPAEELNQDLNAQLAVYTVSCILTVVLKTKNVFPCAAAGYSSGFYAAAYAAGCFEFENGLRLVKMAGDILIDEGSAIDGAMAVIFGLSLEEVKHICQQAGKVQISIINTPRQIVVSGLTPSVEKAMEMALAMGALDAYTLPVATAYHSSFMEQSSARLLNGVKINHIMNPRIPLISYCSLESVLDKEGLRVVMATQLSRPVLWVDLIKSLHKPGTLFIEVGPGTLLSRTVRWIDRNIEIQNTAYMKRLINTLERCRIVKNAG